MKKLSAKQKRFLIKKSREGQAQRRGIAAFRKKIETTFETTNYKYYLKGRGVRFAAPPNLSLSIKHYEETVAFLKSIRNLSKVAAGKVLVDFTTIEKLSPLAALLLTSEIHRWQLSKGKLRVVDYPDWSPTVKRLLHEMGFFDLVNVVNKPEENYVDKLPIKFIPFLSGHATEGDKAITLRKEMEKIAGHINLRFLMFGGLTEAMKNVLHWAYPDSTRQALRLWWMSGSYHSKEKRMTIMIYDHGVGIPATLPRSKLWEMIRTILISNDDHDMIAAAMKAGRTATKKTNRGKGLQDIQRFVLGSTRGILRIISGRGEYIINHNGVESRMLHKTPLEGTLIAWEITMQKEDLND